MFGYSMLEIPNDDYWVIEDFHIYKVKVLRHTFDEMAGVFSITFLRFVDRFDVSPMLLTKTISAEAWPLVFHLEKHNALVILVKMIMKLDLTEVNGDYYSEEYDHYFDIVSTRNLIDEITNEYPERFM